MKKGFRLRMSHPWAGGRAWILWRALQPGSPQKFQKSRCTQWAFGGMKRAAFEARMLIEIEFQGYMLIVFCWEDRC